MMSADTRTFRISHDRDLGPVLREVKRDAEFAAEAVEKYRRAVRRVAEARTRTDDVYRPSFQTARQRLDRKSGDAFSPIAPDNAFTTVNVLTELGKLLPHTERLVRTLSFVTAAFVPLLLYRKRLDKDFRPKRPSDDVNTKVLDKLDNVATLLTAISPFVTLATTGVGSTVPLLATVGAIGTAVSLPLLLASVGVAALAYTAERRSDQEQARRRKSAALAEERRRTAPQHTKTKLEDYAQGQENRLYATYETLRRSARFITELTGKNVDDLLKGLQDFAPKAVESYFQSLREGRGEIAQLSQAQLAHLDLIEKLVVSYRALAAESGAARDAASEYANQIRPVDVIFETLEVHAGKLISQFVGQREELHRSTQATKAQAQAVTELTAATTAQRRATEQAIKVEAAQNQNLRTTTQQHRAASEQIFHTTERLDDLTGALATTNSGLDVHEDHVTAVTEAYRELGAQIGATVGAILSGDVSFKEAWASLGRGVLETVRNLGRQVMDSLLGYVRDLGRGLSDIIFGQLRDAIGSLGRSIGSSFLAFFFLTVPIIPSSGTPRRI